MENTDNSAVNSNQLHFNIIYYTDKYQSEFYNTFNSNGNNLKRANTYNELLDIVSKLTVFELDVNIIIEVNNLNSDDAFHLVNELKENWLSRNLIIIFILTDKNDYISSKAFDLKVSDCYQPGFTFDDIKLRLQFLSAYKKLYSPLKSLPEVPLKQYKTPFIKRFFDLAIALGALTVLSPFLIIIALFIKLDSKGPIFYISRRVGTGYKVFNFYKFRSMRINADKEVTHLMQENQYGESAFFKLKDDPRVTKLGSFLRNSSIDELPQLLNVIKGDMSIVGNRPLPLYEAEQLTTNEWSQRFLGPAGITGLWQIIKRGKADMSDRERKKLDNFYNKNFSIWLDIKIIFMTIPALFQKEKV